MILSIDKVSQPVTNKGNDLSLTTDTTTECQNFMRDNKLFQKYNLTDNPQDVEFYSGPNFTGYKKTFTSNGTFEINENNFSEHIYLFQYGSVRVKNNTIVTYYVSEKYNPEREKGINPFDKTLNILWPEIDLILSEKDKAAISLKQATDQGILTTYDECKKFIKSLG